ncbi:MULTISPECIES: RDD family protein [unclassified Hahella]|uniref:RDD family protein n=1 Tax=unclassified Hahella TaxID=2624107 RepID=UPI001C1EC0B1|nr:MULTISPECIES: RDD family protein [unclassified Hahella]MBU6949896.1 RDD family protein [Hahella sp. HN01]MDG9668310.1 RDD family protein [Hahella sp. CR1]
MLSNRFPEDPAQLQPAPLWRRLAAMFYDAILLIAVWMVTTMIYMLLRGMVIGSEAMQMEADAGKNIGDPLLSSSLFLATFFFFAYFWRRIGQTLGMQVWRIRIQNPDGFKVNWSQCLLRFFGAAASAVCLGLGYLWVLWDKEKLSWHDRFSLSRVVYVPAKPSEKKKKK